MSETQVVLEIVEGNLQGNQYYFDYPMRVLVGKAYGCDIQVPDDGANADVARYHCILDVDPPLIHVRDLGSPVGTILNGAPIGPPSLGSPAEALSDETTDGEMMDGDELRVGCMLLRAHVYQREHAPDSALAPNYYG
jgi:pSer/pThr/pTyr-binding forkhead associated (FHA) protein